MRIFETIEYSTRFDSTRLDSIIRIVNFRTCEYSNVSNYIPKKSGKNRNPRKSEKSLEKSLRNPPQKTQIFPQTLKNTHKLFQHNIVTNVTPLILNHNNDRIKNIRTRLESSCKLSIRLVFESTPNFTVRTPLE